MASAVSFRVAFDGKPAGYLPVELPAGSDFRHCLDLANSPILFGCRTGLCGTCLVEVSRVEGGDLPGPDAEEREILDVFAPGNARARLACQLSACAHVSLRYLGNPDAA